MYIKPQVPASSAASSAGSVAAVLDTAWYRNIKKNIQCTAYVSNKDTHIAKYEYIVLLLTQIITDEKNQGKHNSNKNRVKLSVKGSNLTLSFLRVARRAALDSTWRSWETFITPAAFRRLSRSSAGPRSLYLSRKTSQFIFYLWFTLTASSPPPRHFICKLFWPLWTGL